jgi:hypothetical protein
MCHGAGTSADGRYGLYQKNTDGGTHRSKFDISPNTSIRCLAPGHSRRRDGGNHMECPKRFAGFAGRGTRSGRERFRPILAHPRTVSPQREPKRIPKNDRNLYSELRLRDRVGIGLCVRIRERHREVNVRVARYYVLLRDRKS